MDREFGTGLGNPPLAGQEQLDPARTDRAASRNVSGHPPGADHPPQLQVGAVILGAWHVDHLDPGDPGIGLYHRRELGRAGAVGHVNHRRAGSVEHNERAEPGDSLWNCHRSNADGAFRAALVDIFGHLDRFLDHHTFTRRGRLGQGEKR